MTRQLSSPIAKAIWRVRGSIGLRLADWEFLFNRWHEPEFTESAVLKAFAKETDGLSKRLSSVTLQQHFQVFLHTYVPARSQKGEIAEDNLDCPLTELELLVKIGERAPPGITRREPVYAFRREEKPSISPEMFAYCLEDFWQKASPNEHTLPVRTLVNGIGSPGQVFKIPEEDIYNRVQSLSEVTHGALKYAESGALPQVHRSGLVDARRLLAHAYN
jgi:hypothetical protein